MSLSASVDSAFYEVIKHWNTCVGLPQEERTMTRLDHAVFVPSPDSYEQVPVVQGLDQSLAAKARAGRNARKIGLKSISNK